MRTASPSIAKDRCTFLHEIMGRCIAWRQTAPCRPSLRVWVSPLASLSTAQNLYVGDRSGTIFKIARDRQTFVFSTLEPSVSAYHLAFAPDQSLYVTGPTTSSYDA